MPETQTPTFEKRAIPETVQLPGSRVVEILAMFHALDDVFITLNGDCGPAPQESIYQSLRYDLEQEAFGPIPHDDDDHGDRPWQEDPIHVASWARGHELAADMLEAMLKERDCHGLDLGYQFAYMPRSAARGLADKIEKYRQSAKEMREAGTVNTPWPASA